MVLFHTDIYLLLYDLFIQSMYYTDISFHNLWRPYLPKEYFISSDL